jgi:predicted 2-oxoglutarate/Fe(II)-dependent dioxygenase YbiX
MGSMPPAWFFTRFGFYVAARFLEPELCAKIRQEMLSARTTPGTVREHGDVYIVDEATRRTRVADISDATATLVLERLDSLKPTLEHHFGIPAGTGWRAPQFLVYGPGDFYLPHTDSSTAPNAGEIARHRRLSTVVFLDTQATEPGSDTHGGGALTFYGLLADARLRDRGLPLIPEVGLLVAFPPETVHGVAPVTHGRRCTIVTWLADQAALQQGSRAQHR